MAEIKYIIPFTYKWEGGLSRATTDTASKNPSPYTYKGQTGWHTNKGITYSAFKSLATKLGYQDTADNFLNMPQNIWLKIAKNGYWDIINLDAVKSQPIANVMFSWQWGSGYSWRNRVQKYLASKGINWSISDLKGLPNKLNELSEKQGEKKTFDELIEQKKQFLLSLNQPANEKGWLRRLEDLRTSSYDLLGKGAEIVKKNLIPTIAITFALIAGGYLLYKTIKK
jgi:lysozyme family protein